MWSWGLLCSPRWLGGGRAADNGLCGFGGDEGGRCVAGEIAHVACAIKGVGGGCVLFPCVDRMVEDSERGVGDEVKEGASSGPVVGGEAVGVEFGGAGVGD